MIKIDTNKWTNTKELHKEAIENMGIKSKLKELISSEKGKINKNDELILFLEFAIKVFDVFLYRKFNKYKYILAKLKTLYTNISFEELDKTTRELIDKFIQNTHGLISSDIKKANIPEVQIRLKELFEKASFNKLNKEILEASISQNKFNSLRSELKKDLKKLKVKNPIEDIFNYNKFSDSENGYRHSIISSMNITVCPYCQRNYISNYIDEEKTNDKNRTTADLDHFYPQSKYPYLTLSLYNFIPSCQICNSRMKGDKDTSNAIYPYSESYDDYDAKFKINFKKHKKLKFLLSQNQSKDDFIISINNDKKKNSKVDISNEIFNINKVYETIHNDYILDMLINIRNKPKTYTTKLEEGLFGNSKACKEELKNESIEDRFQELVKAPYKFKIDKGEPLAKLTKDILEEFGIEF